MSICLPKEAQTRKLKSLDKDLRSIADELIAKKFDIKEEVVQENSGPTFPGVVPHCTCGPQYATICVFHESPNSSYGGYGPHSNNTGSFGYPGQAHQQITTNISWSGLLETMRRMDQMNARRERTIGLHPDTFRNFLMQYEPQMYFKQTLSNDDMYSGRDKEVGLIMGCSVIVNSNIPYGQMIVKTEMRWY